MRGVPPRSSLLLDPRAGTDLPPTAPISCPGKPGGVVRRAPPAVVVVVEVTVEVVVAPDAATIAADRDLVVGP